MNDQVKKGVIFFPPTNEPVHVGLTSGHTALVEVEGTELAPMFRKKAIALGCVTAEMREALKGVTEDDEGKSAIQLRQDHLKKSIGDMLTEGNGDDFDGDGKPKLEALSKRAGFNVGAGERDKAWSEMEAGDGA